jgi:hypothetical protein
MVEVDWRAYERRPDPIPTLDPDGEYLHHVWNASVYPMARLLGMTLRPPPVQRQGPRSGRVHRREGSLRRDAQRAVRAFFEGAAT